MTLSVGTAMTMAPISAVAQNAIDLSKWSPEYVESIAGTAKFDTVGECNKVTPTDTKGRVTCWHTGPSDSDPEIAKKSTRTSGWRSMPPSLGAAGPQRGTTSALCARGVAQPRRCVPDLNARSVSLHLADIRRQIAPGAHAVLVLDGAGLHIANDLEIPGNISVLRLPPYAPELNPIENVRDYLRGNKRQ